ncbi:MAG: hypothetical protein GY786_18370, partial [Proteobacteria bacterium]|nr:hypothetical protein [Pseudomonadota bacterium]
PLSFHDILLRYDPTSENNKVFLGDTQITEENINIGSYSRGRFFILPDSNLDFIEVYIGDEGGIYQGTGADNKTYRMATDNEAQYSLADGTVTLIESASTDVLVYYEKSGVKVGDGSLGTGFITPLVNGEPDPAGIAKDFSWTDTDTWLTPALTYEGSSAVTVNGHKSLRVYNPQKMGPFEYFNKYEINSTLPADSWRSEVFLADNSLLEAEDSDDFMYKIDTGEKILSEI